jgi:energy-converting hydrogenase Eha subunit A
MKPSSKFISVVVGYAVALVTASVVVSIYVAATDGPDRQGSDGMYAFGDSILYLGIFGLASIPATGAALFFLRPYRLFWRIASICALAVAAIGVASLAVNLFYRNEGTASVLGIWSALTPLRFLLTPLFAIAFGLSFLFAPARSFRIAFFCATAVETVVFIWVAAFMVISIR